MIETKKRPGRPAKPAVEGERIPLSLRITAALKRDLEASANGRSLSQEAEYRLDRSFRQEESLGGPELARIALHMTTSFYLAGEKAARRLGTGLGDAKDWTANPDAFRKAAVAVIIELMALAPDWNDPGAKARYLAEIKDAVDHEAEIEKMYARSGREANNAR